MANSDSRGGVELGSFFLEGVKGIETEEFVEDIDGRRIKFVTETVRLKGVVEVLYDEILGVSGAKTPEINEERVPGVLLCVSMLESFECQKRRPPGESSHQITIGAENIEGGTHILFLKERCEDLCGVVVGSVTFQNCTSRLQELQDNQWSPWLREVANLHIEQLAVLTYSCRLPK